MLDKIMFRVAGLLISCLACVSLHAQDGQVQVPPPSPPFLNRLPDHAAWRVTYTSHQAPAPPAGAAKGPLPRVLQEVDGTKMDQNRREIYVWSDKTTTAHWIYKGIYLFNQPTTPDIYILNIATYKGSPMAPSLVPDYATTDFPEFSWVSLRNYQGVAIYQQHQCYLFQAQKKSEASPSQTTPPVMSGTQAWIDVKTKLPVALDDGTTLKIYAVSEVPPRDLELPDKFASALADWQQVAIQAMQR
jgi:hypothetical protein